jgi:Na+/H+-dicarboxylate symporter
MPQQVLIALLGGIATGIFFGEETTRIKFFGDIYIGLLQMMVLPYIIISLIGGIGKLTLAQAKQLAKYAIIQAVRRTLRCCHTGDQIRR